MFKILHIIVLVLIPTFVWAAIPNAQERIIQYNSNILINQNATIDITETIQVVANNNQIKRGIFRTIPTRYKTKMGDRVNFKLDVLSVSKNGQTEPYHIEETPNGITIYIGQQDITLVPGVYTYKISYRVRHAIGYFKKYDELYWNVTGNKWAFPIEHASAIVHLPADAPIIQQAAYTGRKGEILKNFSAQISGNKILYKTTSPLHANEGITFAVAWPKNYVYQPTNIASLSILLHNNKPLAYSLMFFTILITFYFLCWLKFGKDPQKGTVIPLYEPPKGYSPGLVHYIYNMGFKRSTTAFTAALTHLSVNGFIKLKSDDDKEFTVIRLQEADNTIGPGEQALMKYLFMAKSQLTFNRINHVAINEAMTKFKKNIKREVLEVYFYSNITYFCIAIVFTLIYFIGLAFLANPEAIFFLVWTSLWTMGVCVLLYSVFCLWREVFKGLFTKVIPAFLLTLFSLPFVVGEIVGLTMLSNFLGWSTTILVVLIMLTHYLFFHWLKQPTLKGRQIMDQIEGFKLFLSVANQERFQSFEGPDITPELFEAYLPYAIALGLENQWSQKFEKSIARSGYEGGQTSRYNPTWYSGHALTVGSIATAIGTSLSSSISTSSTSTSGSSGGGSSGGGGGGGGGGGW
tara:strand:+ start:17809 stop:19707 length:1899 start_codon:yes stop_codon:yes gene_type:complete